jgi:uncharacterized membrane protein YfcA
VTTQPGLQFGLLVLAGVGSGVVGYGAGLASLVSFPTLLALGLPPLAANVTNSVALTGTTLGGLVSARPELRGMRARILRFGSIGVVGGTTGALLLLKLPPGVFERVVPWLIALGSLVLLARPWLRRLHAGRIDEHHHVVTALIGGITIYCGYFGAAAGVLLTAALGAVMEDSLAHLSALRTAVVGAANIAAAAIFVFTGSVDWPMMVPLTIGTICGSALGPPLLRRLPETTVRVAVALAGFALATKLFLDHAR